MPTIVYRNAYLWINGVDYSADVAELSLSYAAEMLDETAMGDDTRIKKGGLKNWNVDITFHQDFSAAHVGANFFALVGTTTCVELRPQNVCTTAINPSFTGIGILESFPPMAGAVGTLLDAKSAIQCASTLSRASSS